MSTILEKKIDISPFTVDVKAEVYDNARELVLNNKNRPVRHGDYAVDGVRNSWHGVRSKEEAYNMLDTGYQPVVERLKETLKVVPQSSPRFTFSNNVQGFLPIVPLALKGVPNSMLDMRIRPMKAKVLNVYYDMTANCDKDVDDFIKAGKLLLGTILALEQQGYRFNLYALQSYWDAHNYAKHSIDFLCVKVKSSSSPFDLKRMSFPLTHPAFFRVIGFEWQGKSPITRYIGGGRGRAIAYDLAKSDCEKIVKSMFGNNAFYLSGAKLINRSYDQKTLTEVFTSAKVEE